MNNELDKALDSAIADAGMMGNIRRDPDHPGRLVFGDLILSELFAETGGDSEKERDTRARLIERAVNGMGAQAKRIAELEAALTVARKHLVMLSGGDVNDVPQKDQDMIDAALSAKGGA